MAPRRDISEGSLQALIDKYCGNIREICIFLLEEKSPSKKSFQGLWNVG